MKTSKLWRRMKVVLALCALAAGQGYVLGAEPVPRFPANTYVNLLKPDALQIPSNNPFTVEGWVKFDTVTATAMLYSKNNARTTPYTYMFGLTGTGTKMAANTGAGGDPANTWQEVTLPAAVIAGRWYHLAFSCDGAIVSFFLDGVCVGRQPFSFGNTTAHTVKIGGYADASDILGNISDVRVWNQTRTPAQIKNVKNRRLNGSEAGLLGYWPMNEGSGTIVADGVSTNKGTFSAGTVTWVTATDLTLTAASKEFLTALPFSVADPDTGSTRFTHSTQVDVVSLPVPTGCDYYQITASGAAADIDANGWLLTNVPPAQQSFALPATDTNVQFYAWFTNTTIAALAQRAEASIFYTEAIPVPMTRATLAIQRLPGQNVIIHGTDLDAGSTGGEANGKTLVIDRYDAIGANPGDDQTPTESFVTLASEGIYPLLLRVRNEAGRTVTGTDTCMVTVTASTVDTNNWTGAGGNDLWHNPANWSAGVPAAGQNVSISTGAGVRLTRATEPLNSFLLAANRTVTVEGWESSLKAITMTINGFITHTNNNGTTEDWITWLPQHRILLEGSNITVAANARLDADYRGYRRNQGPGTPAGWGSGAGHAGEGGFGNGRNGGPAYGDIHAPVEPGSGGATTVGYLTQSSEGGGAIRVVADGCLTVSGTIRANGRNYNSTHGSGGSGGSIWIDCRTLAGTSNGLVQVNGGAGNYYGAGASGGRIALHYDSAAQTALAVPRPPVRFEGIPGAATYHNLETFRPGMGTLSLSDTLLIDGNFTAKRLRDVQIAVPGWTEWALDALTLNDCSVGLQAGIALAVTNNLVLTNGAVLHLFAAPVADVLIEAGATATIGGDLLIHNNAWIMPYAEPTNGATVKITVDGDLLVAAGGGIDADRRGYTRGYGPGHGLTGRSDAGNGAGYGGHGGMGFGGHRWGPSYGDAEWPVEAGSGGWILYGVNFNAGRGGGSIRLDVTGRAEIHGTLTAKGGDGWTPTHGGGGSGGGILLECGTLQGSNTGLLKAEGGRGAGGGSCGGGGRIAVHYNPTAQAALPDPVPLIRFSAYAHPWSNTKFYSTINAQEGTLWLPDTLFLTEVIDQQRFWHVQLVIPGGITEAFSSLKLDNCVLTWPEGNTLTVANDLIITNEAAITLVAAATNDLSQRYGMELNVGRDLRVETNCWIYPQAHPTNAAIVGICVGRNATLAAGGGIDGDGRGYHAAPDNKLGLGAGKATYWSGGGYGGKGGGTSPGATYGRADLPLEPGSPAGWNGSGGATGYSCSGIGGGAVHLRAGGAIQVEGLVTADGWFGSYYLGSGGSGGSIFLAAQRVAGSGRLSARGGKGLGEAASTIINSGGGGRIAVWHHVSLAEIESRLQAKDTSGLLRRSSHPAFTGEVDAGWIVSTGANQTLNPPDVGTVGFYAHAATVILVR